MASDRKKHGNECGTSFRAKVWCNWDACGIVCAVISWFLVLYAEYVVVGVVIYPWMGLGFFGLLHICLFTTVCFLALVSHGKAMLTDPGSVPEDAIPVALKHATKLEEQRFRTCRRCKIFKPARAHHCSICERCVIKMDHHCPWVNNCVGLGNHKFFLLFIFYVFVLAIYALSLVFTRYAHCIDDTYDVTRFVVPTPPHFVRSTGVPATAVRRSRCISSTRINSYWNVPLGCSDARRVSVHGGRVVWTLHHVHDVRSIQRHHDWHDPNRSAEG
ncbi:hypothetical protein DYB32_005196 [Aphanomyces invadans]|uniref:Palmitoyltransferase n=1 Tax=Aphanomyces invadans TaxID=157072 RepID=A0A418AV50_9STRA|nr:hypothetical protein DYB32_005196 [Aphanomyces invadans]